MTQPASAQPIVPPLPPRRPRPTTVRFTDWASI